MNFRIGDTVGTYKIVAGLGSGGMGEVFQVEHAVTGRVEAMKILVADTSATREQDHRFLREIQLQARLSHPNIAAVHNAFWQDGQLIMIMELIQGKSLGGVLKSGPLPLVAVIDYAGQALDALDYAHALGVVHRDISPANMIITEDGTLKLTDFGIAKSLNDIRLTQTGSLLGSLYYASPEQIRGRGNVDARADIYSLGVVLFEMMTGEKLFPIENAFSLMLAHVEQPPRRPSEVCPALPPALDEILLKALEKDPDKRFQSAELFRCALDSVLEHSAREPGAAVSAPMHPVLHPLPQPAAQTPPRNRKRAAFGAAAFMHARPLTLALVLVLCVASWYLWKVERPPVVAPAQPPADFAALPIMWPSSLMPYREVTYTAPYQPLSKSFRARYKAKAGSQQNAGNQQIVGNQPAAESQSVTEKRHMPENEHLTENRQTTGIQHTVEQQLKVENQSTSEIHQTAGNHQTADSQATSGNQQTAAKEQTAEDRQLVTNQSEKPKRRHPFLRAMKRVVRPLHHDSDTSPETVGGNPDSN